MTWSQATSLLAQDQYGNYVVQHVLEHGQESDRQEIVRLLSSDLLVLSQHKFASNVVEMCLMHGGLTAQNSLLHDLITDEESGLALQSIMKDQFGNYVVQKLLEVRMASCTLAVLLFICIAQFRRMFLFSDLFSC